MEPLTLIFIGPQGSGKGTQISKLKDFLAKTDSSREILDVQTGRLFRVVMAKQETFAEKKITRTLNEGVLQPDFLTYVLWGQEMIKNLDPDKHLLIDGFPRTIDQAKTLASALSFFERKNIHIINLDTPREVVLGRMQSRARADDTPESIEKRLAWYEKDTLPVLDFYRQQDNVQVHDIKGDDTIEEVQENIKVFLKLKQ
ncbi:MAG: nucleoside monophosphate kinase [Candidatus Paceibacterota bacterium]